MHTHNFQIRHTRTKRLSRRSILFFWRKKFQAVSLQNFVISANLHYAIFLLQVYARALNFKITNKNNNYKNKLCVLLNCETL